VYITGIERDNKAKPKTQIKQNSQQHNTTW